MIVVKIKIVLPIGKPQKRISEGHWQRNSRVKRWENKNDVNAPQINSVVTMKGLVAKETMISILRCWERKSEEGTSVCQSF